MSYLSAGNIDMKRRHSWVNRASARGLFVDAHLRSTSIIDHVLTHTRQRGDVAVVGMRHTQPSVNRLVRMGYGGWHTNSLRQTTIRHSITLIDRTAWLTGKTSRARNSSLTSFIQRVYTIVLCIEAEQYSRKNIRFDSFHQSFNSIRY